VTTWSLPAPRTSSIPTPPELFAQQTGMRTAPPPCASDPGVRSREADFGGVACVVCEPPDPRSATVYFHGGGYRLGCASWTTPFATRLAGSTNSTVVVVDYRLAPEHPFPAGLHDAAAVYGQLLDEGHPTVVAAGDSAGGGLAAALVVAAATSGVRLPAGLVMMSPWLDLTCTAGTYSSRQDTDQLFSLASAQEAARLYLQGHDAKDPLASPGLADIGTWPPTLILTSTEEVLLQDSINLASTAALAGGSVTALFLAGRQHAWPAVFPDLPESAEALGVIGDFFAGLDEQIQA
jgi:monoterpene epsilon-lactone hydrolase